MYTTLQLQASFADASGDRYAQLRIPTSGSSSRDAGNASMCSRSCATSFEATAGTLALVTGGFTQLPKAVTCAARHVATCHVSTTMT